MVPRFFFKNFIVIQIKKEPGRHGGTTDTRSEIGTGKVSLQNLLGESKGVPKN